MFTKNLRHVRLARESAPRRYIGQRYFFCFLDHALRSLYSALGKMSSCAGCCPKHSEQASRDVDDVIGLLILASHGT